jgi:multidrug efflux system membrane fusion protein
MEPGIPLRGGVTARVWGRRRSSERVPAELELSYTRVYAPFDGQVVKLNLSEGYYAHAGMEDFGFLDSRKWYVLANFRERELKSIRPV